MKKDGIQTRNRKVSQKSKKYKSNSGGYPELGEISLDYLIKPTLSHLTAASHLAAAAAYHPHRMAGYMSSYLDGVSSGGYPSYPPVGSATMVAAGSHSSPYSMPQHGGFSLGPTQQTYRGSGESGYFGESGFQQTNSAGGYSLFDGQQFPKVGPFSRSFFSPQQQQLQTQEGGSGESAEESSLAPQYPQAPPRFPTVGERGSYEEGGMYPGAGVAASDRGYPQTQAYMAAPNCGTSAATSSSVEQTREANRPASPPLEGSNAMF